MVSKRHHRRLVNMEVEKELAKSRSSFCTRKIAPDDSCGEPISEELDGLCNHIENKTYLDTRIKESTTATTATSYPCIYPNYYLLPESESIQENQNDADTEFVKSVRGWFLKYRELLSQSAMNELLLILKPKCKTLPSDSRTFLSTPQSCQFPISVVSPGKYCHFGLKYMLQNILNTKNLLEFCEDGKTLSLSLSINIDGLPLSRSSTSQFWPILISIDNENLECPNPFPIGVYHGFKKPESALKYLQEFQIEFKQLENGFRFKNIEVKVQISKIIRDAPAKSFILCVKGHTGYFSCTKCVQEGEYINGRVTFPDLSAVLRTDDDFKNKTCEDYHRGNSPFDELSVGLVSQVPLDYMHLVCLGVMKRLIIFWVKGNKSVRLPELKLKTVDENLITLKSSIPKEFCRLPRGLQEVDHFKATEFRQILLYTGPFVLKNNLSKIQYSHFMCLHVAIRILCSANLYITYNNYASQLLKYFIEKFAVIYGAEYVSHNVHGLLHLPSDCIKHGVLDNFSSFRFENYLYILKKIMKTSKHPLQQLCNRLKEKELNLIPFRTNAQNVNSYYESPCSSTIFNISIVTNISRKSQNYKICEIKGKCFHFQTVDGIEWSIVKFLCDDKISHVPSTWLSIHNLKENNIALCFWPRKNAGKKIIGRSIPDSESWDKLEVVILKQTDSYSEAREYIRLMSEGESAPETNKPLGKGHRKAKKRPFLFNDSDDSESDVTGVITPPPTIESPKIRKVNNSEPNNNSTNKKIESFSSQKANKSFDSQTSTTIIRTVSTEMVSNVITSLTSVSAINKENNNNHSLVPSAAPSHCSCNCQESPLIKSILSNTVAIRTMLERLTSDETMRKNDDIITDFDLVPKKPFSKFKKLKEFDEKLKTDKSVERQNETALFLLGGSSYKELIRRGLKKIFTDKLATKCSWTGRKNNFPLHNLKILDVLKIATRKKFGSTTDAEFQAEVGLWFRQGKLRFERSLAAVNKENQNRAATVEGME
ncbi:unnamed protein product [Ceutorhynchus assimilis]|uniref:DUF4806 domain-containing protein n=1 Tax=Ceutorhynchus assimilis TaxID=467358 RepID=A0A9N9QEJ3_9CUCU|nr:unnamed protein product [Ceutorhynchus assimilis]